jgi:hypothetical protein
MLATSAIIWAPTYEAITIMATAGMARAMGPRCAVAEFVCSFVNAVKIISFVLLRRVLRPPQYLIAQSIKVAGLQSCRVTDYFATRYLPLATRYFSTWTGCRVLCHRQKRVSIPTAVHFGHWYLLREWAKLPTKKIHYKETKVRRDKDFL